jgi:RecB family exonuclease
VTDTIFSLSQSSLETYKLCNYKFYLKYIKKVKGVSSPDERRPAIFGNIVHKALELYFKDRSLDLLSVYKEDFRKSELTDQSFFELGLRMIEDYAKDSDSGAKIIGVELPFELYLSNGVPVKGIIDRVDELSDEEIEIIDYKTGRNSLSEEELKYNTQLGIYDLVAKIMFPKYKRVKLTLNYLHFGKVSIYRTNEDRDKLEQYIGTMYQKIENAFKDQSEENIKPKLNNFCSYCDYKNICPEFQGLLKLTGNEKKDFKGMVSKSSNLVVDIEVLDSFLENLKAKIKLLESVEKQTNGFIKDYINANGSSESAKIGKRTFSLAKKKYIEYDVNTVIEVLKDKVDLNLVLEPKKGQVDAVVGQDIEVLDKLKATSKIKYSNSYVK